MKSSLASFFSAVVSSCVPGEKQYEYDDADDDADGDLEDDDDYADDDYDGDAGEDKDGDADHEVEEEAEEEEEEYKEGRLGGGGRTKRARGLFGCLSEPRALLGGVLKRLGGLLA
eukprot:2055193-Pyramimonas_sp.AAC.1